MLYLNGEVRDRHVFYQQGNMARRGRGKLGGRAREVAREGATVNRKNLVELMAAMAAATALCGCASKPAPQHTADMRQEVTGELAATRNAWSECIRAAIPRIDHPESSSADVARTAISGCSNEYTDVERALTRSLTPTCGRDPDCTRNALAKARREAALAATDDVVTARVRVAGAQVVKCE
jgi:hypothetical protein